MRPAFLSANWRNLLLANYSVPRALLRPHLPRGVELDLRDGRAWCSLVAFQFLDTRVGGIPWPGFRHFPEWNLRFYVRRGENRGVCFVREFVPQRWVAAVARSIYNEPYVAARLGGRVGTNDETLRADYAVYFGGKSHRMRVVADRAPTFPEDGGVEDWFKEHQWGFGRWHGGRPTCYEVLHPRWRVHRVRDVRVQVDWAALYGGEWEPMNEREPDSVLFAEGSAVRVYPFRLSS